MEIGVDNKELFYEIKNESARILQLFIDTLKVEYHPIVIDENVDYKSQDNMISYITLQTENKYLSFFKGIESINKPLNRHSRIGEFIIITSQNNYIPNEITISFNGYRDDKLPQYMQDEITSAILELKV